MSSQKRVHKTNSTTSVLGRSTRGAQKKGEINAGNSEGKKMQAEGVKDMTDGHACVQAGR